MQPGYTFAVDENGYEGLVKNKPILVVYTRGGAYPEGSETEAFDMQKNYVELFLGFIGFDNIHTIVVEPTLMGGADDIQAMLDASVQQAQSLASNF